MKIISKFRDFYDYKVAKYGVDKKLIYTRKTHIEYYQGATKITEEYFNKNLKENINYSKENNFHKILFIGEKLIHLFFTKNRVYTHFDIKFEDDMGKRYSYNTGRKEITFNDGKKYYISSPFKYDWNYLLLYDRKKFISKYDTFFNEPIFLIEGMYNGSIYKITYNPNLSRLGVYINEDFVWESLVEFLSIKRSEKEVVPEVSNENKILSKGFDLKSSFRPNMKKKK